MGISLPDSKQSQDCNQPIRQFLWATVAMRDSIVGTGWKRRSAEGGERRMGAGYEGGAGQQVRAPGEEGGQP